MPVPLLTLEHKKKERLNMIELALKDQAPKMYQDLKQCGQLQNFLRKHEQAMMESYEEAQNAAISRHLRADNPNLNPVPKLDSDLHRAWEETLATWLEFSDI